MSVGSGSSTFLFRQLRPKPPSTLNKETIGVWSGWCNIGDKEVAREAAAKGLHIRLAITFLSLRQNIDVSEAEVWFKNEVVKWVSELLERRQIFKASHIYNNIRADAGVEFTKVFYETTDNAMRAYIGAHLAKTEKLSNNLRSLWDLLIIISENVVLVRRFQAPDSIRGMDEQPTQWRAEIASVLFLKTDDLRLVCFLQAETLWAQLLANNDTSNLLQWIKLRYNFNVFEPISGNLADQFRKMAITNEMLNRIHENRQIGEVICNELSKFGVFIEAEKDDFIKILSRLKNSESLADTFEILAKNTSSVHFDAFLKMLINYCLENNQFSILNATIEDFQIANPESSHDLQLIDDFRLLVTDFNEEKLQRNIFKVSQMLSKNLVDYFNKNPLILLTLIMFNYNFVDLISNRAALLLNGANFSDCVPNLLENLPILNAIAQKQIQSAPECTLTIYDLLDRHSAINSNELFKFRYHNTPLPYFNSPELLEAAYCKTIGYKFYLKQARPGLAAKMFVLSQFDSIGGVRKQEAAIIDNKVQKLAILNYQDDEITASCVAFLEMIGRKSTKTRVLLKSAKILAGASYTNDAILDILLNCDDDPYSLQMHLEHIIMEKIEGISLKTGVEFIEALDLYEIVVQFSKLANIKLPELFLKHCAGLNQWLQFLIFAQIHGYPLDQLKMLIQFFKSPNMLEHLTHGVVNDIQVEDKNVLLKERNLRKDYLYRVGFRQLQSIESLTPNSSIRSQSVKSWSSEESGNSSDFFEIDILNIKATLLQTLIRCQNSTDPPKALLQACQLYRNPLLAVLATSYEPDSVVTNWLTWLAVSCELCQPFTNYETVALSANLVTKLLEDCLTNGYPQVLLESFEIFLPDNTLKFFLEFLIDLVNFNLNQNVIIPKLEHFRSLLKNTRKNSIMSETDHEMTYLTNRAWIEATSLRLLAASIEQSGHSLFEQMQLVEFLQEINISKFFQLCCPNFSNLAKILKSIEFTQVRFEIGLFFDQKSNRQAIVNCINKLLEKNYYEAALLIAEIEGISPDLILVKQCQSRISNKSDSSFWQECDEIFRKYKMNADCVVEFYLEYAEKMQDSLEKFIVLKLAWEWTAKFELTCQYEIEKRMWLVFLFVDEKSRSLDCFGIKPEIFLYKDLGDWLENVGEYDGPELAKDIIQQLEKILAFVLNKGNFWLALRLQKMFKVKSTDMETLKVCHSLAEGILLPHQLSHDQRLLISNTKFSRGSYYSQRRTFRSTRLSSISSTSHSPNISFTNAPDVNLVIDSVNNDTLAILKLLTEQLHNGFEIGQNIFMMFRISINIEIPYQVVAVTEDYMKILKDSLEDNCMNKFDVVNDFISVYKWKKATLADFICEELISAISYHIDNHSDTCTMWDINLAKDFPAILQLLQDNCSVLGYKLYTYLNAIYKLQIELELKSDFVLVIELLIKAHDCFTADCNMEGISMILKKSKEIISKLLIQQDWKLIVRLATGVARYTEMNYVFQILHENDQFEFLLRKSVRKDNTLKVALLEYLKKFCPENKDVYKIVALHFTLFSEVAFLWEREAENIIKNLISVSILEMQNNKLDVDEELYILLANTESTKKCLNKAMEAYTHATDFHLQGEKLTKAMASAKQAELIALQVGLLAKAQPKDSAICLLNLSKSQIPLVMSSQLSFEQGLIVAEAYNFEPDWASILYQQYYVQNNDTFFEDFSKHLMITDTLVHDLSRKFINSSVNSVHEIRAMKNVLCQLRSPHAKYRIASELGFTDLVADLIASGQLVYLKDTVWKRGYKS